MEFKIMILLINLAIFCNKSNFINANPLVGDNVETAQEGSYTSAVCIIKLNPNITRIHEKVWCAGVLITYTHVLSAGHCFEDLENFGIQIHIGSVNLGLSQVFWPMWMLQHDIWVKENNIQVPFENNDIAVMKLLTYVDPAKVNIVLPILSNNSYFDIYDYGVEVSTVGWGLTNSGQRSQNLLIGKVKILTHENCNIMIRDVEGRTYAIPGSMFCTSANPYLFLDDGDSGSPLYWENILIGIGTGNIPKNNGRFHPQRANLHIDVSYYRYFIDTALAM